MRRLTLLLAACALAGTSRAETVEQAIAAAIGRDPDLAAAAAERDAAQARLDQARAEGGPTVSLSGSLGVGHLNPGGFFGITAEGVAPRAAQITAEMPIFTGGRLSAGQAQASAGLAIGNAALAARERQLELDVASAYADVYAARTSRQAASYGAAQLAETERQAELLFRAGETARTEYLQAQARRAEAQAAVARAEGELQSAAARFMSLTGLAAASVDESPGLPAAPASRDEAVRAALAGNPAIVEADAAVAAAQAAVRGASAERMPNVAAFAEGSSIRDQFFPDYKADAVTAGVRARWTIFDSGRTRSKVAEATAGLRSAEARSRSARRDVEVQTVVAWEALQAARSQRLAAEDQRNAAQAALRDARLEFQAGAKPLLVVMDAERDALAADAAVARSDGEVARAAWRLHILTR
ncbi:MAG: TolC family protein [Sphingomonas sp.]|nr:TolC family protein [Sphingomonas sp.]